MALYYHVKDKADLARLVVRADPQRPNFEFLNHSNYRTMGGRVETGDIKTKTMLISGMGDNLSWPVFNASYAEEVEKTPGPAKANSMFRFYLHDNGSHITGGGQPGIFRQSIIDLMAWVEKGDRAPTFVGLYDQKWPGHPCAKGGRPTRSAAGDEPHGQWRDASPSRCEQSVKLVARLEMPPKTGKIVQYTWTVADTAEAPTTVAKPQPLADVAHTITFDKPGTYAVRLTVNGQRDGLVDPADQTLLENFKEVRVVVE